MRDSPPMARRWSTTPPKTDRRDERSELRRWLDSCEVARRPRRGRRKPRASARFPEPAADDGADLGVLDQYRLYRLESRCYVTHHGERPLAWKVGTGHRREFRDRCGTGGGTSGGGGAARFFRAARAAARREPAETTK